MLMRITHRFLYTIIFSLLFVLCTLIQLKAQEVYVSDHLVVKIRDKIEAPYTVVDRVKTDEQLTVLDKDGAYLFVVTRNGRQGWIEQQYIKKDPPKSTIIKKLENEIAVLKEILGNNSTAYEEHATKTLQLDTFHHITIERDMLAAELELIKEKIRNQVEETESAAIRLESSEGNHKPGSLSTPAPTKTITTISLNHLSNKNSDTQSFDIKGQYFPSQTPTHDYYWFLAGAFVFLSGIILSKFTGRRKKRICY